jgi:hypothetical protein
MNDAGGGESVGGWWLPFKVGGGDNRERGVRQRGHHAASGLDSTGGRRPYRVPADRGPTAVRAGGAPTWLTRGPRLAVGEGVRSGARGTRGPAQRNAEWAEPQRNSSI